jgi:hypothetical protein
VLTLRGLSRVTLKLHHRIGQNGALLGAHRHAASRERQGRRKNEDRSTAQGAAPSQCGHAS